MDAKVGVNGATLTYLYDGANLVQEQSGGSPSANILAGALDEVFTRTCKNAPSHHFRMSATYQAINLKLRYSFGD